jgi:hypothetical protein
VVLSRSSARFPSKRIGLHTYPSIVKTSSAPRALRDHAHAPCASGASILAQPRPAPRVLALALFTVARPRARPTPRPRVPLDRNMGAFLSTVSALHAISLFRIIPQHVWHNKVPDVAAPNINLLQVRNAAIASCDRNVLELDVHVVLGCRSFSDCVRSEDWLRGRAHLRGVCRGTPPQM